MKNKSGKRDWFYYYLMFLVIVLPLIPKEISTVFSIIPTRLVLLSGLIIIYFYQVLIKKKEVNKTPWFFCILYALMLLFMFFGIFKTMNMMVFFYSWLKYLIYGMTIYVIYKYKFKKKDTNNLIIALIISSLIASVIGLIQYIFNFDLIINGVYKYPGALGRVSSTFYNPIYFGIFLMLIIILCFYRMLKNDSNKILNSIVIIFSFFVMLLTFTRTVAVLTLIVSIVFLVFAILNYKRIKKILLYSLIIFISFITLVFAVPGAKYLYSSTLFSFLPYNFSINLLEMTNKYFNTNFDLKLYGVIEEEKPSIDNNDGDINDSIEDGPGNDIPSKPSEDVEIIPPKVEIEDASNISRDEFKQISLRVIKDNIFSGVGIGTYEDYVMANYDKYVYERFGYPHNLFLHIMAECGVVAISLFMIIFIYVALKSFLLTICRNNKEMFTIFIISVVMFILAFYESYLYDTQLGPIILIIISILFVKSREDDNSKQVMFISSVGGHLTQLLQFKNIFRKYNYILITEKTDVTKNMYEKYNMRYLPYGSRNQKYSYPFTLLYSCIKSVYYFIKYNPRVIISTGANTAAAMCCLGKMFNKKVIYIESFAKRNSPTITGKCIYKLGAYTTFVVQWKEMLQFYPNAEYWGGVY